MNPSIRRSRLLMVAVFSLFVVVLVRNAWLGEDAYIGLRTVENFVHGDGLTWNVSERVQAFTCPLWILLQCAVYAVTREAYYTTICLSLLLSVMTAFVVWRTARSDAQALFGLIVLVSSKAFIDYSTSGLENPLTHLLLACFLCVYFKSEATLKSLFLLTFLAALAMTNRMDSVVLLAPALLVAFCEIRSLKAVGTILLALTPFLLWEGFSLFYYGFLFPNTAYAKLGTGIEGWESVRQGAYYFRDSLLLDPLTLLVIGGSLCVPFVARQSRQLPLALGLVLYMIYVLKVGGDFMSGRFFTAPLLVAVCMVGRIGISRRPFLWGIAQATALVLGLSSPGATILSGADYHPEHSRFISDNHGIVDERGYYYYFAGLLPTWRHGGEPTHAWVDQGREARARHLKVVVKGNIGYFGYYAGRDTYIVDPGALTDPLLARLPAVHASQWRAGHFTRVLPEGYKETLQSGKDRLVDRRLAVYREKLSLVVSGPLFDRNRLLEIWRFNTGAYENLLDKQRYRDAAPLQRNYADLSPLQPHGKTTNFGLNGIEVALQGRPLTEQLDITLDNDDEYDVVFLHGDVELARTRVEPPDCAHVVGLNVYRVAVPYEVRQSGCDRLRIVPVPLLNDGSFSLGYIQFVESAP